MIERILVGTEGSQAADNAVSTALRLARAADAEIRAVHARETPEGARRRSAAGRQVAHQRERAGERVLEAVTERAGKVDVPATTVIDDRPPAELLLAQAREWGADLLAIGAQGESGFERAIRGSVADQLIRGSPVPVLTVHQPPSTDPLDPIERLVVPSDGSSAALSAAPVARALAQATGARLDLVFAVPPRIEGGELLGPTDDIEQAAAKLADDALAPLERRYRGTEIERERRVRHDAPHRAIVHHADERDADMIVMSTRGHGSLERVLLGSVADKVLRTSNVPVVTVNPPGEDDHVASPEGRGPQGART
jgi:nucleotide-binding universal stress UspA family protein